MKGVLFVNFGLEQPQNLKKERVMFPKLAGIFHYIRQSNFLLPLDEPSMILPSKHILSKT